MAKGGVGAHQTRGREKSVREEEAGVSGQEHREGGLVRALERNGNTKQAQAEKLRQLTQASSEPEAVTGDCCLLQSDLSGRPVPGKAGPISPRDSDGNGFVWPNVLSISHRAQIPMNMKQKEKISEHRLLYLDFRKPFP